MQKELTLWKRFLCRFCNIFFDGFLHRTYDSSEVLLSGSPPDGGLYVPAEDLPQITVGELQRLVPLDYCNRALRILEKLLHPNDIHPSLLRQYIQTAFGKGEYTYSRAHHVIIFCKFWLILADCTACICICIVVLRVGVGVESCTVLMLAGHFIFSSSDTFAVGCIV